MLDKKYERYWDTLDIDDELRKLLDAEYEEMKRAMYAFYGCASSFDNMGEELVYRIIGAGLRQTGKNSVQEHYRKQVNATLKSLTKKQKLAFELYYMCEYKQHQVAEIMKISQPEVSRLILRAKIKIKKKLNK